MGLEFRMYSKALEKSPILSSAPNKDLKRLNLFPKAAKLSQYLRDSAADPTL